MNAAEYGQEKAVCQLFSVRSLISEERIQMRCSPSDSVFK